MVEYDFAFFAKERQSNPDEMAMNERERWVIYPFLFFLFLLAIRDNAFPQAAMECTQLVCNRLSVQTPTGRRLVEMGGQDSGVIIVYGTADGGLDDFNWQTAPERSVLELGAESSGGYLTLYGPGDVPTLKLAHYEPLQLSGLLAVLGDSDPLEANTPQAAGDTQLWGPTFWWDTASSVGRPSSVEAVESGDEQPKANDSTPSPGNEVP